MQQQANTLMQHSHKLLSSFYKKYDSQSSSHPFNVLSEVWVNFVDNRESIAVFGVSSDEILEDDLRILEITSLVIVSLSVDSSKSLLKVLVPPDVSLHV